MTFAKEYNRSRPSLAVLLHNGSGSVVLLGKGHNSVSGELGTLSLLKHVVSRAQPPVGSNLLKGRSSVWKSLEDPHKKSCTFHGALLVQPLKLELDIDNVVLCFLRGFTLEGQLARHQHIHKNTKRPDIRLRIGLSFFNYLRSSIVKVVCTLDLSATVGYSLSGFKVGKLDLNCSAKRSSRSNKNVGGFKVQVHLASPVNVVKSIKNLATYISNHLFSVAWPLGNIIKNSGSRQRIKFKHHHGISLIAIKKRNNLFMLKSLQVLKFTLSSITSFNIGLVKDLDRVQFAFFVNISSDRKSSFGNLIHKVNSTWLLSLNLHVLLFYIIVKSRSSNLNVTLSLYLLKSIIKFSSRRSR